MAKTENVLNVCVNYQTRSEWKEKAKKMRISVSELIRIAMREYLERHN